MKRLRHSSECAVRVNQVPRTIPTAAICASVANGRSLASSAQVCVRPKSNRLSVL